MPWYDDDDFGPWRTGADPDVLAHPDSPSGGGGPGRFAARGPLGGDGARVPHPDSLAARHMADTSGVSARLAGRKVSQHMDEIARVTDWDGLKAAAQIFLGPKCFSVGVCLGIAENPVMGALGLLELGKTFVLADVYDTLYGTRSWTSHLTSNPGGMLAKLGGLALVKLGVLEMDDLKHAHEAREAMLKELGQVFANPVEFLGNMAGQLKAEYAAKWQRFNVLYADADLGSQFEAGRIAGGVIMDVATTIIGALSAAGAVAKLASKLPHLVRVVRLAGGPRGAGGRAAAEAVATEAKAVAPAARKPPAASVEPAAPPPKPPVEPAKPAPETPKPTDANRVSRDKTTNTGHPVDVATGKVFTEGVDFEMPGPLPLRWERVWYSSSRYRGPLGHGWHHLYDAALVRAGESMVLRTPDGRERTLPVLEPGQQHNDRAEKTTLFRDQDGYGLRAADGLVQRFGEPVPGEAQRLTRLEDAAGHALHFGYDQRGLLTTMRDSGGRELALEYDELRRIREIRGPHATDPNRQHVLVSYRYDPVGNLAEARDALEQASRFEYRGHLLVKEIGRTGFAFHFEYDGDDSRARCRRTYGDGGAYERKLTYEPGCTTVEDGLGHSTKYFHARGLVHRTVNALGAVTETVRNQWDEVLRDVDALGQATTFEYDDRGNAVAVTRPDGAVVRTTYDAHDRPISAVDAIGGTWHWHYDERGRLVERVDSLGRSTRFRHAGAELVEVVDGAGARTELSYDETGALVRVRAPSGAEQRFFYDRLGRVTTAIDPKGNQQHRIHDALGRVVRVEEPDGNVRSLVYDGENRVVRAQDAHRDVHLRYVGTGRVVERREAGTTVTFEYDKEERLTAVRNEHGAVYRFVLGPTGLVDQEVCFDETTRTYQRDAAGRVVRLERTSGRHTDYRYDGAGRLIALKHDDGSSEDFVYRADGALTRATNGTGAITFERDLLGRVLKESAGEDWVANAYDVAGRRTSLRSSRGFEQQIEHDIMGDVVALRASGERDGTGADAGFSARFTRDELGLELERRLPGGVRARWDRDRLGRPVRQELWSGAQLQSAKEYTWDLDDRLRAVVDAHKGPISYTHDALGNLAAAIYADGRVDLRLPDAVGNLFRTESRRDRKYGPAGQLLESRGPSGEISRYDYDPDGNLRQKTDCDGGTWHYTWNAGGLLAKVTRPDGATVRFGYDPFGRRVWKKYGATTTRWLWDGNVPLHEWSEVDATAAAPAPSPPITWLFAPGTFAPLGKLVGQQAFSIVTDHLGAPTTMLDAEGRTTWSAELDAYGNLRNLVGDRHACPFRWPGQYEDPETGLYYNRFRYYHPDTGQYISRDPIGLLGGLRPYGYVRDPSRWLDPLGLCEQPNQYMSTLMGSEIKKYYDTPNATLGAPGRQVWLAPLEDYSHVATRADAVTATGHARSVRDAYLKGEDIYGVSVPKDGLSLRLPTAGDAGANPHWRPGGYTGVEHNGVWKSSDVREFVTDGGAPMPKGSVLYKVNPDGSWTPVRKFP